MIQLYCLVNDMIIFYIKSCYIYVCDNREAWTQNLARIQKENVLAMQAVLLLAMYIGTRNHYMKMFDTK